MDIPPSPILTVSLALLALGACRPAPPTEAAGPSTSPRASIASAVKDVNRTSGPTKIQLIDNARAARLLFNHQSGATGEYTYPEVLCGGICIADLDQDQDLDVYLPQGGQIAGVAEVPEASSANRLFLNDGAGNFSDQSNNPGAGHLGYGVGAFAADVDGDLDLDLLLTNVGPLALLINDGGASFTDRSTSSGIPQHDGFWMNASFADFDGDSNLDVYVANYTDWSYDAARRCFSPSGLPDYCPPANFPGESDLLLMGNGDGTFRDVTMDSGVGGVASRSMGVVTLDVDGDLDLDIYVACDDEANLLWINQGDGTFKEEAMIRGAALNAEGAAEAGMGIACADIDADGDEDLIISHLAQETHTVYRNDGGYFVDVTAVAGLGRWCRPDTGFGIGLVDFDNDTLLDLMIVNGGVARPTQPADPNHPYAQPDRIARGLPGGHFPTTDVIPGAGTAAGDSDVSRGAAFGDLNGDGLVDAIVVIKDGPARLLVNATETDAAWIGIRPVTQLDGPSVISAQVEVSGQNKLAMRTVRPHGSYLGSSEDTVRFGLGSHESPVEAVVGWPGGGRERFADLEPRRVHALVRGTGSPVADALVSLPPQSRPTVASDPLADGGSVDAQTAADRKPSADQPAAGTEIAELVADDVTGLGPIPPLRLEAKGKRGQQATFDQGAMESWCLAAGLPAPPQASALDAPTWKLVHQAIEAAGRSPSGQTIGNLAMYYDGHGAATSAIELYQRAGELEPDESKWWHLLGRAQLKQGLASEATQSLAKAANLQPRAATVARLAEAKLAAGKPAAATRDWRRYVQLQPKDALGYAGLARASEAAGDLQASLAAAEEAIKRNPHARQALVLASRLAARLGDEARAADYGKKAESLTKADDLVLFDEFETNMYAFAKPVVYLRRAANYYKQKQDLPKSLEAAKLLAERRPDEAQNWQLLLWLATVMRDQEAAIEYAEIAVELAPDFAPGWETLARQKLKEREWKNALDYANRALKAEPRFVKAHLPRGLALGKLEQYEEALKSLEISISADPTDVLALRMKTVCLMKLRRQEEAQKAVKDILAIDPKNAWALDASKQLE